MNHGVLSSKIDTGRRPSASSRRPAHLSKPLATIGIQSLSMKPFMSFAAVLLMAWRLIGESGPADRPRITSLVAGRAYVGGDTLLLESLEGARVLRIDSQGRVRSSLDLARTPVKLDASGLAVSEEGLLWVLADAGTVLIGFDPTRGTVTDTRPLPSRFQRVWSVGGTVMLAAVTTGGGEPLLFVMTPGGVRPCGAIRTRPVSRPLEAPILSIFDCGSSRTSVLPCWWLAGDSSLIFLRSTCTSKQTSVPSLVKARTAAERGSDPMEWFDSPIRDAFTIDDRLTWLLTNQEGSASVISANATVARHLLLLRDGRLERTLTLPRRARFILHGDTRGVSVLYSDGTTERIELP